MTIEEYFKDWSKVINLEEANRLARSLSNSRICPKVQDIYRAFHLCPLNSLRVVIIGQDPYPNLKKDKTPVATGIAFANSPDTPEKDYSPSLEVLRDSVIDFTIPHRRINFDPSLEKWERQGVLLLNTALSCLTGQVSSHTFVWKSFIKDLLINLSKHTTGIIYVLMGNNAIAFEPYIDSNLNHIIKTKHPSWYARTRTRMPSDVWKQINEILIGQNGYGIEWYEEY